MTKVQPPVAPGGMFTRDAFDIDLEAGQVTCPNGITVPIRQAGNQARYAGMAEFGLHCRTCPLAQMCTSSTSGRRITIVRHEARLTAARTLQRDWSDAALLRVEENTPEYLRMAYKIFFAVAPATPVR